MNDINIITEITNSEIERIKSSMVLEEVVKNDLNCTTDVKEWLEFTNKKKIIPDLIIFLIMKLSKTLRRLHFIQCFVTTEKRKHALRSDVIL